MSGPYPSGMPWKPCTYRPGQREAGKGQDRAFAGPCPLSPDDRSSPVRQVLCRIETDDLGVGEANLSALRSARVRRGERGTGVPLRAGTRGINSAFPAGAGKTAFREAGEQGTGPGGLARGHRRPGGSCPTPAQGDGSFPHTPATPDRHPRPHAPPKKRHRRARWSAVIPFFRRGNATASPGHPLLGPLQSGRSALLYRTDLPPGRGRGETGHAARR
jgi:hypothetical protein